MTVLRSEEHAPGNTSRVIPGRNITPPMCAEISAAEQRLRFTRVAEEVDRMPWGRARDGRDTGAGIGTLGEKRLHATIKRYLYEDVTAHEQVVKDEIADRDGENGLTVEKPRRMIADVLTPGGEIFEVQTGGFFPLRAKVEWYLSHTTYRVTVVHPMPAVKYLSWIDPTSGQVISRRKSPKRGQVRQIAKELYWLAPFIGDPRFSLRVLLLELEEYRLADGWGRDGKRGSNRYDRFPTALMEDVTLATAEDYAPYFLPDAIPYGEAFTAATYARATAIRGKATYATLRILCQLGLLRETDKIGRSMGFIRV